MTQFSGVSAAFWVVLLGGLMVPLGEELLFRGVGYGSMRRYGPVIATIVSSLVFALAHGLNVVFLAVLVLAVLNSVLYGAPARSGRASPRTPRSTCARSWCCCS